MKLLKYKYLSQEQLKRFDTYKYASIDNSPLSQYVMHPFWNQVVKLVPKSVAPNVLTLAGFSCTLMNAFLLTYYDYYFQASSDSGSASRPVPSFVWLVCSINLFLAHTLDGIDGKQARRTKATGPLGELMDHGVDSWTAIFVPMFVYSLFGTSEYSLSQERMFFIIWAVFLTVYVTHWEKYITGVLILPWSYDVSQLFLLGCFIATYLHSYKIWKGTLLGLPYSETYEIILYASIVLTLPQPIYNVYTSSKSGSKHKHLSGIIRPLVPFVTLFLVSFSWAHYSRTNLLVRDPRIYYYLVGTIFSNLVVSYLMSFNKTKCVAPLHYSRNPLSLTWPPLNLRSKLTSTLAPLLHFLV